ncbi:conserved hypothetical protein [Paenibacillus curdlanolyticus YK9]|uniref:Lipoprotein n=1 Tax=Paenibacillus curdlanolyticus YK9 TaxID=717606 RepID=E0I8V9_9BACL|nr:hypothetical protein [Paenibacillus curdlanolyticus]EFM10843.1 conserved hypothetical protein [Paenibacillus curdlanolyticus YK9]
MKWIQRCAIIVMAAMLLVAAGCSSSKPPKEVLETSMTKMSEMKSYGFTGTIGFDDVNIPAEEADALGVSMVTSILKGAKLTFEGQYEKEPYRMDLNLKLEVKGDGSTTSFEVPILMNQNDLYVKIPTIPGLPIPEELTSKFIKIDLKKLAEEQGTELPFNDMDKQVKLGTDIMNTIITSFDEKDYFFEPKAEEVQGLPKDGDYDQIVQFKITDETFAPALELIVNKVAPAVIDLLAKDEDYLKLADITKEDLDEAKKQLAENGPDAIKELKKAVKINEFAITGGVKDKYMTYQGIYANIAVKPEDSEDEVKVDMYVRSEYKDINKKQTFKHDIPTDTISMEDAMQMFGGSGDLESEF